MRADEKCSIGREVEFLAAPEVWKTDLDEPANAGHGAARDCRVTAHRVYADLGSADFRAEGLSSSQSFYRIQVRHFSF